MEMSRVYSEYYKEEEEEEEEEPSYDDKYDDKSKSNCRFIARFRENSGLYQFFVSRMVHSPVHVDYVLDRPGTQHRQVCFSAYMGHKFSATVMPNEMIHDPAFQNWSIPVSSGDFDRLYSFLHGMKDKTPYNYSDSLVLLPTVPHENIIVDTLVSDLELGITPERISSVFCSQAGVLVLRECIRDSPWLNCLVDKLKTTNSRLCSPFDLLNIMRPYATEITNADLHMGICQ